ncbi:MAG: efflux RND transporter permease subunit [Porphyromonas sp.]|uniref:efflux RND transporter permease subunit n=1 Tax=Porphyromonas sp. TaxID=1924944 RepID=UPI001A3EC36C|nr:efflux RND transporter permease subunit [Porphyromonas sp.]MBL6452344.1 efflux RND transporter permease subunit [Porphyromonas sp.]
MKLPEFGVKRPIAAAMLFVAILVIGVFSLTKLPLDLMPNMEFPSLTVITVYPGASAIEVEEQVSKPLEAVLSSAENLVEIKSISKENVSFIQLRYEWEEDITAAANNARDLLELVKSRMPSQAYTPIIYKINASMMPILGYAVNADENYNGLEDIVEDQIASALRKVDGVGTVIYLGQPQREIRVEIDPTRMQAYGMSVAQLSMMLKANNINVPSGFVTEGAYDFSVRMPGKYESVEELENTVIKAVNGRVVRVKDVATVRDTFKETDASAFNHVGKGIALLVQKQSGANTVDVVNAVRAEIADIQKDLPSDVQIFEVIGSDELVTSSINNLSSSIWYALIFVTLVVLLFLREWKSSLIVFLTMPVSLISAFIVMNLLGYTINIFSLVALVIAIGMVVDNAIVVLENITQHIERGAMPKQAAMFGASEMGLAIAASTLTTIVVFLPLVFMGGIVGVMFKQLAVLTVTCMITSLFTALALTPMLSSVLLKPAPRGGEGKKHGKLYNWSERMFQSIERVYRNFLGWAVFHKGITLVSALVIFAIVLLLGKAVGTDYIPDIDAGSVSIQFETEQGTSHRLTEQVGNQIVQLLQEQVPEVAEGGIASITGQTDDGVLTAVGFKEGKNIGTIFCHLKPVDERKRSSQQIADDIRPLIEAIPEIEKVTVSGGSAMATALTGNRAPIEFVIYGKDINQMNQVAFEIERKAKEHPEFTNVEALVSAGNREVHILVDKDKASQMALNPGVIGIQVRENLYGAKAGAYTEDGTDYDIRIQYAPDYRNSISKLREMQVTNLLGQQVPLIAVADIQEKEGPVQIERLTQQRYVKVTSNLNGVSLGDGAKIAEQIIAELDTPQGVTVSLGGQVEDQGDTFSSLTVIFIIGLLLVFMVMAAQFESLLDPFIILFAIPFTLVGVILAFLITGTTLSVVTFIGLIMLVGIVVNNGIVLVDYSNMLVRRGYTIRDAVMESGRSRLRPVLMTSMTTILGMLPMALSRGMGKELYAPLGITIIGGLLISMLVTLILVPTAYAAVHQRKLNRERRVTRLRKHIKNN